MRDLVKHLEYAPLGDRFVVHNTRSGSIISTDTAGRALLENLAGVIPAALEQSASLDDTALSATAKVCLPIWREAGLFDSSLAPYPDPVCDDGRRCAFANPYTGPAESLHIETDDERLSAQLDEILGGFSGEPNPVPAQRLRCVSVPGGGVGVFDGSRAIWGRATRDEARYLLIREAAEVLCGEHVGAVLHAAAVSGPAGTLLLVGASGTGKSTLAQGLVAEGFAYVSDDHLPLHKSGSDVLSFPTGSAMKQGAVQLPEIVSLAARHARRSAARSGVTYLHLPGAIPIGTELRVNAVVFPAYEVGASLEVKELDPETALVAAVHAGARPARRAPSIHPLARLFHTVPAIKVTYGASLQSLRLCRDLLAPCAG